VRSLVMEPEVAYEFWFVASASVLAYELWFAAWASALAGARMLWESARMCPQSPTAAWKECLQVRPRSPGLCRPTDSRLGGRQRAGQSPRFQCR
jgi:hypothetical protein